MLDLRLPNKAEQSEWPKQNLFKGKKSCSGMTRIRDYILLTRQILYITHLNACTYTSLHSTPLLYILPTVVNGTYVYMYIPVHNISPVHIASCTCIHNTYSLQYIVVV